VFAAFSVCESVCGIVTSPFALQNLRNGIPVAVVVFDAVGFHPLGDEDVIAQGDVVDGDKIFPKLYDEAAADDFLQKDGGIRWKVVIGLNILVFETRYLDSHLTFEWTYLRDISGCLGLRFEVVLQQVGLHGTTFEANGCFSATLVPEPLGEIRG